MFSVVTFLCSNFSLLFKCCQLDAFVSNDLVTQNLGFIRDARLSVFHNHRREFHQDDDVEGGPTTMTLIPSYLIG